MCLRQIRFDRTFRMEYNILPLDNRQQQIFSLSPDRLCRREMKMAALRRCPFIFFDSAKVLLHSADSPAAAMAGRLARPGMGYSLRNVLLQLSKII